MKSAVVWVLVLLVGGLATGAAAQRGAIEPDASWVYKEVDGQALEMSVFLPEGYAEADQAYPVFVVFHGGAWRKGEPALHFPDCVYWAGRGMVAASVRYRLKDKDNVRVPLECVKDAKAAVCYLRANAEALKLDPDRIVAAGASAGGQLAAATAAITDPRTDDDATVSSVPIASSTRLGTVPPRFLRIDLSEMTSLYLPAHFQATSQSLSRPPPGIVASISAPESPRLSSSATHTSANLASRLVEVEPPTG